MTDSQVSLHQPRRFRVDISRDVLARERNFIADGADFLRVWVEIGDDLTHVADMSIYLHRAGFVRRGTAVKCWLEGYQLQPRQEVSTLRDGDVIIITPYSSEPPPASEALTMGSDFLNLIDHLLNEDFQGAKKIFNASSHRDRTSKHPHVFVSKGRDHGGVESSFHPSIPTAVKASGDHNTERPKRGKDGGSNQPEAHLKSSFSLPSNGESAQGSKAVREPSTVQLDASHSPSSSSSASSSSETKSTSSPLFFFSNDMTSTSQRSNSQDQTREASSNRATDETPEAAGDDESDGFGISHTRAQGSDEEYEAEKPPWVGRMWKRPYEVIAAIGKERVSSSGCVEHSREVTGNYSPLEGDVIAFQELSMDPESFLPVVSDYRYARVLFFDGRSEALKVLTGATPEQVQKKPKGRGHKHPQAEQPWERMEEMLELLNMRNVRLISGPSREAADRRDAEEGGEVLNMLRKKRREVLDAAHGLK